MSPSRAVLVGGLAAVAALLAPAAPASALSCVDTETVMIDGERAFIGTLVARDGDRLTFDVAEVFRGELPEPFVVRDDLAPTWAIGAAPGTELGLVVHQIKGELLVNQCGLVPPERLRRARDEGWPLGNLRPGERRLVARSASVRVSLGCSGRCAGTVVLRAPDGVLLGRTRVDLRRGVKNITLRLTAAARRRLARNPRLPVRLVVRLAPARKPIEHRLTLVRGRG